MGKRPGTRAQLREAKGVIEGPPLAEGLGLRDPTRMVVRQVKDARKGWQVANEFARVRPAAWAPWGRGEMRACG